MFLRWILRMHLLMKFCPFLDHLYSLYRECLRKGTECLGFTLPLLAQRKTHGAYFVHLTSLHEDEEHFAMYFRMAPCTFIYILQNIFPVIEKHCISREDIIGPKEMLMVFFRYVTLFVLRRFVRIHKLN